MREKKKQRFRKVKILYETSAFIRRYYTKILHKQQSPPFSQLNGGALLSMTIMPMPRRWPRHKH